MVPVSGFLLSRYCHDCAESDVKQYSLTHSPLPTSEWKLLVSWCLHTHLNSQLLWFKLLIKQIKNDYLKTSCSGLEGLIVVTLQVVIFQLFSQFPPSDEEKYLYFSKQKISNFACYKYTHHSIDLHTLAQRYVNVGLLVRHAWSAYMYYQPANTNYLYNICTMLDQRLRRCSNIVQMLYKCFVFLGNSIGLLTSWFFSPGTADLWSFELRSMSILRSSLELITVPYPVLTMLTEDAQLVTVTLHSVFLFAPV